MSASSNNDIITFRAPCTGRRGSIYTNRMIWEGTAKVQNQIMPSNFQYYNYFSPALWNNLISVLLFVFFLDISEGEGRNQP